MPAIFIYLIKVNVALLIFCGGYYAVLRHLTFYNLNRVYLVTAIIFSTLYPLANLTDFLNHHEMIAKPVQVIIINWQEPVKIIVKTFLGHDQWYWLQAAFWVGVIIFAIRLLLQLLSLYRLHKRSEPAKINQYLIRVIKGNINPFSFWRNIYINPENHAGNELKAILEHEYIHVKEWHTLDILLSEISAVFYWFNPGIWLIKHAIRENLEFITDRKILQRGVDSKAYQYSLLNVNFGAQGNTIVNHFNISTIKKRIMMMNAKRSSRVNITRYLFLIPAVMVLLLVFSVSKAELNKAVKSSTHLLITLKKAVAKIDLIPSPANSTAQKITEALTAVSLFKIETDTIIKGKLEKTMTLNYNFKYDSAGNKGVKEFHITSSTDTNKNKAITIRGTEGKKPDIYINGVKTDINIENISPNSIESVSVYKDDKAFPNGVYIVTKPNADNTKDTVIKGGQIAYRLGITGPKPPDVVGGVAGAHPSLAVVTVSGRRSANGLKLNDSTVHTFVSSQAITKVRINGKSYGSASKKIVVNGDTVYANTFTTAFKAANIDTLLNKLTGAVNTNGLVTKTVTGYRTDPVKVVNVASGGRVSSISFANKPIIIDGKEASQKQMKKLSADKIESISILKDDAAVVIYGEKARNGIVIITTKK